MRTYARRVALGGGLALFLWLRLEDNAVWTAALFGLGGALLMVLPRLRPPLPAAVAIMAGIAVGGGGAVAAAALMLLKNGLHGHVFPDYPFGIIAEMLLRAPVWAAAGALVGIGWALAFPAHPEDNTPPNQEA